MLIMKLKTILAVAAMLGNVQIFKNNVCILHAFVNRIQNAFGIT